MKIKKSLVIISIASSCLYSNCQVKENLIDNVKNANIVSASDHINLEMKESAAPEAKPHLIAKMRKSSCPAPAAEENLSLLLEIPFRSVWDESNPVFQVNTAEKRTYVLIGENKMILPLGDAAPAHAFIHEVCAAGNKDRDQLTLENPASQAFIKSLLGSLAPDCRFTLAGEAAGWFCQIDVTPPATILKKLEEIQGRMVRKWQRQPYILARKMAVGMELASLIHTSRLDEGISSFCTIAGYALPQELPTTLQAKVLRDKLCESKGEALKMRASLLLSEIYKEVDVLVQRFEGQSPLGTLVVHLPQDRSMTQELWINLKLAAPEQGASAVVLAPFLDRQGFDLCWHHLYENDAVLLANAVEMSILAQGDRHCIRLLSDEVTKNLVAARTKIGYSISSEMEFSLTNGRGIMLRLPQGEYSYTVMPHPHNISDWSASSKETARASGMISWKGQHPVATIRDTTK